MKLLISVCAACFVLSSPATAKDDLWEVVFEDDFERSEVGDKYSGPSRSLRIEDGRLFIDGGGHGAYIEIDQSFVPDVKVEFVAEANPEAPPCDIAVALASRTYLLQFGAQNNRVNQIYGHLEDSDPPFLIEHGKLYHCVVTKEGSTLRYDVNGTTILEAKVEDVVGGPGFDRIHLVTWDGMYVDDLKIHERTTPAPDGPVFLPSMPDVDYRWENRKLSHLGTPPFVIKNGIDAYNKGDYAAAIEHFTKSSMTLMENVAGLAYVLGDLNHPETEAEKQKLAELAQAVSDQTPFDKAAKDFALAARWFSGISLRWRNEKACTRLIEAGPMHNPFYYKAKFYMARFQMAHGKEGGNARTIQEAIAMFKELKEIWPDQRSLREFTGESIPWGEELIRDEADGPAWARYLQEAFSRQQTILNWWHDERQYEDGSLGGGWGDDVEILRGWVPAVCISTACEKPVAMIEKLAQGVWDIVLEEGYDRSAGDVEHSAEPSADSLPTMLLLRYGDPKWVEYNLQSAKTIREKFMGVTERGSLNFYSTEFGMEGINRNAGGGGDTGYHARALKHHIWLGWYGIPAAGDVFVQWCDGWREITMAEIGTKPSGFAPSSVFFPSGGIDPPMGMKWYDDRAHYYGFPGLSNMVFSSFITAYLLSDDRGFLDVIQRMMTLATHGPLAGYDDTLPPDDINNLLSRTAHWADADLLSVYRLLTDDRVYDEYILRSGTPTQRYFVQYDLDKYAHTFERLAKSLRTNWTQHTVEVIQTDRAGLGGSKDILGAYTGAVRDFRDMGAPTMAVTYDTPDLNFAGMVTENSTTRLRVTLYNFNETPTRIGLRPWRLDPGHYELIDGEIFPGEQPTQHRYGWSDPRQVEHIHRGTPIYVDVPSQTEWVVDLRMREPIDRPALLPDLAIMPRDIQHDGDTLTVTIHNIGGAPSEPFDVVIDADHGQHWHEVARKSVNALPAITKLEPVRHNVTFNIDAAKLADGYRVVVNGEGLADEVYALNNRVVIAK